MGEILSIALSSIFVNNYLLSYFLGLCPLLELTNKPKNIFIFGVLLTFFIFVSNLIIYPVLIFIIVPLNILFLKSIIFILLILLIINLFKMFILSFFKKLYNYLGIYIPMLTFNCVIYGAILINLNNNNNLYQSLITSLSGGIGYIFALFIMSGIKEKLDYSDVPKSFKGLPVAFITTGIMVMAFMAIDKTMISNLFNR